jgi:hypothetical protein
VGIAVLLGGGSARAAAVDDAARRAVDRRAMAVLGAQGALSLGVGLPLALGGGAPAVQAAGGMTAAWGAINGGIAGLGAVGAQRPVADPTAAAARTRRVLAVNIGLDALYVGAGAWMAAAGAQRGDEALRGAGAAIVAQGGFLWAFDAGYLVAHRRLARGR